ncbi:glyoxysomal fatty acid beta-oxidation multifunctional protein MFP-a-like isoform X2 [Rutidosis leptorrhynchoides]|uniref:glyoxysomal fatty acid beta-oxidation multifunctional protein MFP-a-like isoform X2 n=1 Tax=Rutidosis leptorrhynchoides TaxID=125765 RepID=UPI003A99D461
MIANLFVQPNQQPNPVLLTLHDNCNLFSSVGDGGSSSLSGAYLQEYQSLLKSNTRKSLVNTFFAQRDTTKVLKVTDECLQPRRINKLAILGRGLMGSGIATTVILNRYEVLLKEVNQNFLHSGLGRVKALEIGWSSN